MPWLDLYETAFPPSERVRVSFILNLLKDKARGLAQDQHLLSALDQRGAFQGLAMYELYPSRSALLWYLAITSSNRSKGLGSSFYQEILRRVRPHTSVLLYEVEIPSTAESDG